MNPSEPPAIRSFLAVDVSPPIHAALVDLKRELAASNAAVRWVRDDGLHATVKFLGPVPAATLGAVYDALRAALAAVPRFAVAVGGLGAFPNLRRPRVLWVSAHSPALADLAAGVDAALAPLGFATEARPFQGHITLGRVNGPSGWPRLEPLLKAHWGDEFGTCEIGALIGYRSDLRRGGAVYTKLWTIPLGAE